jgi:hypothetical protein
MTRVRTETPIRSTARVKPPRIGVDSSSMDVKPEATSWSLWLLPPARLRLRRNIGRLSETLWNASRYAARAVRYHSMVRSSPSSNDTEGV